MANVLFFGDVVGKAGCERFAKRVRALRQRYDADVVVVNGENSAEGNGVTPLSADMLLNAGADVLTGGNHSLRRPDIGEYMERQPRLLRPANLHPEAPGKGVYVLDNPRFPLAVVSLLGTAFMGIACGNPYDYMDGFLRENKYKNIIVDFHGEATSEKLALAHYLDGRVSAVLGTHTHVPTADARIFPKGTAYITDVGMCGGRNSVLGVKKELAIYKQRTGLPTKFANDPADIILQGVWLCFDKEGRVTAIERFED